jgi:hypothetical protein
MKMKGDKTMQPKDAKSGKTTSGFGLDSPKPIKIPFCSTNSPSSVGIKKNVTLKK